MQTHECALAAQGKEAQILRTEILAGGETGGECMSGAESGEAESEIAAMFGSDLSPCKTTGARCFKPLSDEPLMADR